MGTQHYTTIHTSSEAHLPLASEPAGSNLPNTHSFAELLKTQGYECHMLGKWVRGQAHMLGKWVLIRTCA